MPQQSGAPDSTLAVRLAALQRLSILDTPAEAELEGIVALAAHLCAMPISTITFVDADRQWFKARIGLDVDETPREFAFCAWTVEQHHPLIVADTTLDARFAANPLVTGPPHLRFYAGFPLEVGDDGVAVGTLTVMDRVPRALTEQQMQAMRVLARQVCVLLGVRHSLGQIRAGQAELIVSQLELRAQIDERNRRLSQASRRLSRVERLYNSLWETTTDAAVFIDERGNILYANPSAERLFGYPAGGLDGLPLDRLQPERLREAHRRGMRAYMDSGIRRLDWRATETFGLHADGSELPIEISFSEVVADGDRLFVGFMRDISERRRVAAELQLERERAQSTLRCIGDGVITTDEHGRVRSLNPLAERLSGWQQPEAVDRPCGDVLPLVSEVGGAHQPLPLADVPRGDDMAVLLPARVLLRRRDGSELPVEGSVAALAAADGRHTGWVIAIRDVSRARELAARVDYQATHDALTGLVNRGEFDRRLRIVLSLGAARKQQVSLLYLDLDQFKIINDTCGHVAGDELLKQLSDLLLQSLRSTDTLARLGGDEFGVLLENCPSANAVEIASKLRDAVAGFVFVWKDQMFSTGVSIGHVHFEDEVLEADEALSRADEACYVAKDLGRNRIHTYSPGEEVQARRHGEMQWVGLIRNALDEDRFALYAQPIFAVGDRVSPVHHEILLRMTGRDGALVQPMAFIPAAERYNLMPALDRWVVSHVIEAVATARRSGRPHPRQLAINLSGATLGDTTFAGFVAETLQRHGMPGEGISFEITETAAIANFNDAVRLIQDIKSFGCRFALDDFGSGLSSFAYLKHLPVDYLKIDGSFVRTVATDAVDRAMVASINEIGHLMGLQTIAEFVENEAILAELRDIGVDFAQGFELGRPIPLLQCFDSPGIPVARG